MLSRLSGLASTVLQELSGDDGDAVTESSSAVQALEPEAESMEEAPEELLERLAQTEKLVVQLKDLIREKDALLQQKETVLKKEREAADAKLMKLKLQAKAKLASLNKRIEELTEKGSPLPAQTLSEDRVYPKNNQNASEGRREEDKALKKQLREQEEAVQDLKEQLAVAKMDLKEAEVKYATQLSSLQEVIWEKEALLEEQVQQHQAELLKIVAQSDLEAEMQQNLRTLQRNLEEQEAALLGRTQVVELLQQELRTAEQQNQTLLDQCQKMEMDLSSLRDVLDAERQESQDLREKMELELAERKLSSHRLQEEVQCLLEQLEEARRAQAELEMKYKDLEQEQRLEVEEKNLQISCLKVAEQELQSSHAALVAENGQLKQDVDQLLVLSVENSATIQKLQDELAQKSEEFVCCQNELKSQSAVQVSELKKPDETTSDEKIIDQEDQNGTSLLPPENLQRQKTEEIPHLQLVLREPEQEAVMVAENVKQNKNAGPEVKLQDLQTLEAPASYADCSSTGVSGELVNSEVQKPFDDTSVIPEARTDGFPNGREQFTEESCPPGILEYLAAEKQKELSVLLLELKEAQEEITFLKRQLESPNGQTSTSNQTGEAANELEHNSQIQFLEKDEQKASDKQNELGSSSLLRETEMQHIDVLQKIEVQEVPQGSTVPCRGEMRAIQEVSTADPEPGTSQSQELVKLQNQITELQIILQKSEESYKKDLGEKGAEINRLNQLAEEYRRKIEDSDAAFCVLTEERDQLLYQMQELSTVTELQEQVKQLEESLALSEKQRHSDSQSSLLREQIQSLKNEFKTKEIKIEALQKDLDEAQLQLSDRDMQLKDLRSQIKKKECEGLDLEQLLRKNTAEIEELSQNVASKGREAARLEQLVAELTRSIESLQQTLLEKDQQMTEISVSMSEKIVLLNEDKFSLENELKSLKEQTSLLLRAQEEKEQNIEAKETYLKCGPSEQQYETEVACKESEVLVNKLELLQKENEQVKRKLQAALVNRKELLKKVGKLENELVQLRREHKSEASVAQEAEGEENMTSVISREVHLESQPSEEYLIQLLSEKESELQSIRKDLLDKETTEAQLQAVIEEMRRSLQGKTNIISTKDEIVESQTIADKVTETHKSTKDYEENEKNSSAATDLEENQKSALRERISTLEQEKDQLQKKLQEALVSRKDTIKKAQEKDRHHREQLKQQKDDYNILQEQFDKQSKEKESIQAQLRQLQEQKGSTDNVLGNRGGLDSSCTEAENTTNNKLVQVTDVSGEEFKKKLEKLQMEKEELEYNITHTQSELACKSELVFHLQEHIAQLFLEIEGLKRTSDQAEAKAASLQTELEESQAKFSREGSLEDLKTLIHQKDEEMEFLNLQLKEKSEALDNVQAQLLEKEDSVKRLCSQLEAQARVHEEQSKQLQTELLEIQEKQDDSAEAAKQKNQMQRKLQAALISRKEALKESKSLKEELANAKSTIENLCVKMTNMESQICGRVKETDTLMEKIAGLTEEREKLIAEVDKVLRENENLDGCCKNLTFTLDGLVLEKEKLEKEMESLKGFQAAESSEWHEKYGELQKEYETLLQSYENVSNEAERIQRVLETVRQEKQDIFIKLKSVEAKKEEADELLQEAGQEIDGMKEKMRKFAKSKQQKILELEEENEKLRAEMRFADGELHRTGDVFTNTSLKEDVESSRRDYQSLSTQLETVMAEKESLNQEITDLKCHLQLTESKLKESRELVDKYVAQKTTNQAVATPPPMERTENQVHRSFRSESPPAELEQKAFEGSIPCEDLGTYIQQIAELTERITELEDNRRASEQQLGDIRKCVETLAGEKRVLESQMEEKVNELNALQDTVAKMEQMVQKTKDDLIRMTELKDTLEAEKDDLEERLMNQLAELNGSIGNYQQDATDFQIENERLKHELQSLQRMVHELEEEKCQMAKEKSKASSEKQKELVEKLKCSWRGDSSTHVKELQELLKQKQQEIKQLQKDCIKSQEKTSSLERTVKALEFLQSESQKEVEAAKETLAKAVEDTKKAQAELALCRVVLDDTQSEAARVLAESVKVKEEFQASKENIKIKMKKKDEDFEKRLEQEKDKHSKEIKNMEEKLATLQREKDYMETTVADLQDSLKTKDREAKQLEGSLNKTLAQLAAFTRSMSSLQDDRDRVIDESKTWEKKFTETIQKKEEEIRSKEETCVVLKDQMKQMTIHVEELQTRISRLECNKKDWESESRKEIQHHQKTCEMLQEEKKELLTQLEGSQKLYSKSQNEQQKLESEICTLRDQLADLQNSFTKCELVREELGSTVKQQEVSIQNFKFSCEQLEADLQASKDLTNKLHEETSAKDQKIISLLSAKEEAVMAALSELQQQHSEEIKVLEHRLSKGEEDRKALENEKNKFLDQLDRLTEKMKINREESKQQKAQLDSFTKSMSSLQDDRDRILRDYKQLEERHLVIILEKDQLIQEAAAENNKLKEEMRSFHSRMDDLNSENAKLNAELVRYREDLNQVISVKDSQQKQLLKTQLQRIQTLEKENAIIETQLKESKHAQDDLRKCMEALRGDKDSMSQEIETLTSTLSQVQSEMTVLHEGGPIMECQARLKAQEGEAQELSRKLSLSQKRITELEGELVCVQRDAAKRVEEAEDRLRKELKHLHHDAGIMRNETETAEERVAELARDLMEMEQKFLEVTDENKGLRAQIQSFGKSMSSLQDSRDQANEELRVLKEKYCADLEEQKSLVQNLQKQMVQLQEEQHATARDRDTVRSELTELQRATDERGLLTQIEKINQKLRAKDDELLRLSSELEGSSNQVKSFSKAMASLQNERDRLLDELGKRRKVEEVKQQAEGSTSTTPSEVQSLKKALSSLQNDRDRLVRELKNLQQQYILVGVESAENSRLKAQLQEYQQDSDKQHRLQEQLKQESIFYQQELQQLRQEKTIWEKENSSIKEQYLMVIAEKDKQLSHLQRIMQEMRLPLSKSQIVEEQYQTKISSEAVRGDFSSLETETKHLQAQLSDSLKELHQKELRIQQLNSKLSQVFEEKNALSLQLRGSGRNICESHQHYNEVLNRCLVLERQLQELQSADKGVELFATDAAPGAPQEKNEPQRGSYTPELQELQLRLSETEHLHSSTKQDLRYLEEQLEEERDRRLAVEEALSAAQDQIRRLQSSDWTPSLSASIDMAPGHEHSLLTDSMDNNFSKTQNFLGLRRLLRSLFRSRTQLPLLVAVYLLALHVLLFLPSTGSVQGNCNALGQVLLLMTGEEWGAGTQEVKTAEVKTGTRSTQQSKSCRWPQVPEQKASSLPAGAGEHFKMWKAVVGHDVSVKVEAQGDDWDTDPDFVNDVSEQEQRWGARTVEGSGRAEHIDIHQLRNKVSEEHEVIKKKELETGPKASYGYGGKFGTERDRMDKCAVGHEYVADVGKHSSQTDATQGFGGKYGVQRDRADKSALGFEYKGEVEKHSSQKDYSKGFGGRYGVERDKVDKAAVGFDYKNQAEKHDSQKDYSVGFGGKFGVQRDRQDKSALGWDHQEEVQPHASQTDYAKGFGGHYGVQKDRVDKSAGGFDEMVAPTSSYEKTRPLEAGASSSTSSLRSRFENMAKSAEENRRQAEKDRVRQQAWKCQASRWQQEIPQREKEHTETAPATVQARVPGSADQDRPVPPGDQEAKREDEETPPTLPPRPADLGEELCKVPSQDQPIYCESLDVGGDYEELPEPSDYCDSTNGGADYEEVPAPLGKLDAIYDHGGGGGEDYEEILPEDPSQGQSHLGEIDNVYEVESPGTCAVALYDYQGDGDDEISFDPDDTITHIEMVDEGWWRGQCRGKVGLFPANYVKLLQ
ncbi:golgin subfamily B member 1 [Leptosomus discolor]